ncbi:MAG TPA: adenosylcobinamide-GDP ribazoletransferase [Streptosporangiaceae bacterium]|nr:adenosylcobinamide-GDP ribazoletransferase [Streptosporangiaceae bacterium]
MFTIIPVTGPETIGPALARRMTYWLPVVGGLLAVPAAGIVLGVEAASTVPRRLLAATLAIAVLGLLTGGLHLDGLADTADGLGSRRPAGQALEVMRRSDTGPMGVAALVFVVLVQIAALAAVTPRWLAAAALIAAAVTGRVGVLLASGAPAARSGGLGGLIAGTTSHRARWLESAALLAVVGAAGWAAGGVTLAVRGLTAVACGLVVAAAVRWLACRRFGGMTGDVYGALIELGTATVLLVAALSG